MKNFFGLFLFKNAKYGRKKWSVGQKLFLISRYDLEVLRLVSSLHIMRFDDVVGCQGVHHSPTQVL